jgi:hypothetical protein
VRNTRQTTEATAQAAKNAVKPFSPKLATNSGSVWQHLAVIGSNWQHLVVFALATPDSAAKTCAINNRVRKKSEKRNQAPRPSSGKSRQDFFAENNGGLWRVLADCGGSRRNEPVAFKPIRTLPQKHAL